MKYILVHAEVNEDLHSKEEESNIDVRIAYESMEQRIVDILNKMYWYNRDLTKLYFKLGSYREIERQVGIPWRSCYDTIEYTLNMIRYELRKN